MSVLEEAAAALRVVAESYEAKARTVREAIAILLGEEEPSTSTTADAAETSSPSSRTDEPTPSGASAADTTSPRTATSGNGTTSPSEESPVRTRSATRQEIDEAWARVQAAKEAEDKAPIPPPQPGRKRQFTNEQKGLLVRRCVREGVDAVSADTLIHPGTLHRWMRDKPQTVKDEEQKIEVERRKQALAEAHPPVEELEAEAAQPTPARVQWPSGPITKTRFDPDEVRRRTVDGGV